MDLSFEECAKLIAAEHHQEPHRSYEIRGHVSQSAINEINRQVSRFEQSVDLKAQRPSFQEMIDNVLRACRDDDLMPRTVKADLYIVSNNDLSLFFEIKGLKPNKGQCLGVFERLLRFYLLATNPHNSKAYYAMAYNPYGYERSDYKWSVSKQYTPFDDAVLIGHEFWTLIGGEEAYSELLEIYQEVGREKSKYILDTLAFDF